MPRYYFHKLVRDKVVPNCLDDPEVTHTEYRALEDDEYQAALVAKLAEEAAEIPSDAKERAAVLNELADLQNVVDALREYFGLSEQEVRRAADLKTKQKGGFTSRHYISYVDITDGSEWNETFREQPHKYPEVKE